MSELSFPLDITGLAATNKVVDENHTLTEINASTYRIIIPDFAPFYLDNFSLKHIDSVGVEYNLREDVDFNFVLPYIGGSRSIGKMLYGGISINTELLNGSLKVAYQTLGGDWLADPKYVRERLAELIYNPRVTVWDIVTNKPNAFPPTEHQQHMDTVFGHRELIEAINALASTIVQMPSEGRPLIQHLLKTNNPHNVTKIQVELGDVENLPIATAQDIQDKNPVRKYITLEQALTLFRLK